jgi:Zn-dependent protease with chaperone function
MVSSTRARPWLRARSAGANVLTPRAPEVALDGLELAPCIIRIARGEMTELVRRARRCVRAIGEPLAVRLVVLAILTIVFRTVVRRSRGRERRPPTADRTRKRTDNRTDWTERHHADCRAGGRPHVASRIASVVGHLRHLHPLRERSKAASSGPHRKHALIRTSLQHAPRLASVTPMRGSRHFARARVISAAGLLLVTAVLAGCDISEDQEVELGRRYAEQVAAQLPLVHDSAINTYVADLGARIARGTSRADLPWQFAVVDAREVNAFALPGGFIYVNRGLIERADRMNELAGVLGHEIGHVVLRHSVKQMEKATKTNVGIAVVCTLTGWCEGGAAQVAINVAGSAWFAHHSRQDEAAADSDAVFNVTRADIDPSGIPRLFEKLLRERRASPGPLETWFLTHPLEESRVERTRELVRALPSETLRGVVEDSPGFQTFKQRVRALPPPPPRRALPAP